MSVVTPPLSDAEVRPGPAAGGVRRARARVHDLLPIYLFILPGVALYAAWMLYPVVSAFVMSLYDWQLIKPSSFVGVDNYIRAIGDPKFWSATWHTFGYALVTVAGQLGIGLAVALIVNGRIPGRSLFRLIFYLPVITSWVVASIVFTYLYSGQNGALNWLLVDALQILPKPVAWLAEPATALWAVAILGIWKGVGWTMVVYLAGLQAIPVELHEAAALDGAGSWGRFRHVTLPLLARTTAFLVIALTLGGLSVFVSVFVMTDGGPLGSSEVLLTYMYRQAFTTLDLGYGSAIAQLLALCFFVIAFVELRFLRRQFT